MRAKNNNSPLEMHFSTTEKLKLLRGMFSTNTFKETVRPMLYGKADGNPETVHENVLKNLSTYSFAMPLLAPFFNTRPELQISVQGKRIAPFGTAAGLDKDGDALAPLSNFFGFLEPGTVVINAREGNPKPRVFAHEPELAIFNAQGFPSKGIDHFENNLKAYSRNKRRVPIYVSICGLPLSEENALEQAMEEMKILMKRLEPFVDGFVWNPYSPNTSALTKLRNPDTFMSTAQLMEESAPNALRLVKIGPYTEEQQGFSLNLVKSFIDGNGHGVVTSNTLMVPRENIPAKSWGYASAGESGRPLFKYMLRSCRDIRGRFPDSVIIATGGIFNGHDAFDAFKNGSTMVSGFTPYTFYGVGLVRNIKKELFNELRKEGYDNLTELQEKAREVLREN